MTFRELLDKYRAGQASEEERALVEAELEKSEAIADYLAEQVEDALGAAETQAPAGEVRHIQKKVNRRLRRTAVWAACIVLAVLLGALRGQPPGVVPVLSAQREGVRDGHRGGAGP